MNTQIPSGLQALMQASQILQQEAAQTAPGPQGQQPTVASQVQQAASQQMPQQMPNVQQVGQQAGIAAQLMAQRQQQAQDPRAVAQMAAQMLQQQGVASLPTNMQFREGGIIGYAGPQGSVVANPIADRKLAPMGGRASSEAVDLMTVDEFREYEQTGIVPDRVKYQLYLQSKEQAVVSPEEFIPPKPATGLSQIIDERIEQAKPRLGGPARASQVDKMTPDQFREYEETGVIPDDSAPVVPPTAPSQITSAAMDAADASIGGIKPTPTPAKTPPAPSQANAGIVQALTPVRADRPATPTYPRIPEDPEEKRLREEYASSGAKLLAAKKAQADLEAEGIAALRSSEAERKRLLESKRSRDSFNSFMALVRDLRLRNNEYGAYMASIDAREEADRLAGLANEQAVIKLKEAQQAKALGNVALERELKKEAYSTYVEGRKRAEDAAKNEATFAAQIFSTESSAANSMADRANQVNIELARMTQQAQARKDAQEIRRAEDLRTRLTALTSQLARSGDQIASELKKDERFKSIESLRDMAAKNMPLNDAQKKLIQEFSDEKRRLEQRVLPTINAQLDAVMKELGIVVPQVSTTATGAIDFSALPGKASK